VTYHSEPAVNRTGHEEPLAYACRCGWTLSDPDAALSWTGRVEAVRDHLTTTHGWHHLPPSTDGTAWHFPEDYPA